MQTLLHTQLGTISGTLNHTVISLTHNHFSWCSCSVIHLHGNFVGNIMFSIYAMCHGKQNPWLHRSALACHCPGWKIHDVGFACHNWKNDCFDFASSLHQVLPWQMRKNSQVQGCAACIHVLHWRAACKKDHEPWMSRCLVQGGTEDRMSSTAAVRVQIPGWIECRSAKNWVLKVVKWKLWQICTVTTES